MKQFFPRIPFSSLTVNAGNKMRRFMSRLRLRSPLALVLITLAVAATLFTLAASASRKANSGTGVSPVNAHAQDARATKSLTRLVNRNALTPMTPMPFVPTITATLDDNFPLASKKNPGDTINYTAVITNTAGTDASGIAYTDTLDNNTTLSGVVRVSPVTVNNSYTCTGNVSISVPVGNGVLTNDYLGQNPAGTITASDVASTQGGTVTVNADGSFTYNPPANFTGTDTFTYTLSNVTGSSVGTVTITVSDRILFVNGAAGNCKPATPCTFATADALAAPTGKDLVFVLSSGSPYSGAAISLNAAQTMVGQFVSIGTALTDAGITLAPFSQTLNFPASTTPVLNNSATVVTLGGNNLVEYFAINPSAGTAITGNNITTGATIHDIAITGTVGANGVSLTGTSTGSTFNFSNLTITTASGTAFNAVGPGPGANTGGTLNLTTGSIPNTLTTNTGTALNVVNATIGGSNLNFQSITAGTNAGGPTNAIILNNTGSSGGLIVTGTGTTGGSGGTIQRNDQAALFTSTQNLSLKNMNFTNAGQGSGTCNNIDGPTFNNACKGAINMSSVTTATLDRLVIDTGAQIGINGQTVSALTISNSTVKNFGSAANTDILRFFNLTGTCSLTNSTFQNPGEHVADIRNNTGTLTLSVTGSTFTDTTQHASGAAGLSVTSTSASTINLTVDTNSFTKIVNAGYQTFAKMTSTMNTDFINNTVDPQTAATGRSVDNSAQDTAHLNFNINHNVKLYAKGGSPVNIFGINSAVIQGRINNNTDIRCGGVGSAGTGVNVHPEDNSQGIIDITGNTISQVGSVADWGIHAFNHGDGATHLSPQLDVTIASNSVALVNNGVSGGGFNGGLIGIGTDAGENNGDLAKTCANVHNNTVTSAPLAINGSDNLAEMTREGSSTSNLYLQGFVAGADNQARATNTWNANTNTPNFVFANDAGSALAYAAPPAGAPYFGVCRTPSNPTAMARPEGVNRLFELARMNQTTLPFALTNIASVSPSQAPSAARGNTSSSTFAWLKQVLHPVAAFASNLNFLRSSDAPVTPTDRTSAASASKPITPFSGEMISFSLPVVLNVGKSVTIKYDATVNTPPGAAFVQTQGNVTFTGGPGGGINTTDPETGTQIPTKTNINTVLTWIGVTSTDWNTTTNWDFNYVPLSFSDVKVPNAAQPNQPTLSSSSPTINSLNLGNTRVLTISGQTLTISGNSGSDLTLDGNINGGALSFGAGTHTIFNTGATGSITPTNTTTVLNGANVTLNNNLQADSLTINSGGTLNITNRTLSLTGSLSNAGTLTLTGSTVIFNGSGAQTLTNTTAFNNLTSNNTGGSVTLGSNATVNGTLTLTSDLTTTNSFTLTMPIAGIISGGADVVGNFTRTNGGPQFPSATNITFGNPNTLLNFTAAGTRPTSINFKLTKTTPTDAATGGTNTGFPGAVARTYVITPTGGSGYSATMQLHYLTSELNGNSEAQPGPGPTVSLRLYKYVVNNPGTGWQQQDINNNFANTTVDTSSPGNHFVKLGALGFNGFSPWTIGGVSPTAATSTVSGRILDDNGNPVEGAVIRMNGTQNRKVITDANGNYNFFNVETNGFYTVTPSRVNYNFTPSTRGFSALGAHTEASFGATYNGGHQNPIDTTEYFVRQQYVDFLGREPEENGFNAWSDIINNCAPGDASCDRVHVSESFFKSNEFQQRGYFVYRFYSTAFGRKPDYAEFTPDMARVSGFLTDDQLEAAKTQFANDFTMRAAFVNQYGMLNNSQYVDALAQTAGVTLSNRQALIDSLNAGTMTRAQALRQITESNDVYAKYYNQAFVVMEYFGYLKRDPDAAYTVWIDVLNANPTDSRHMVEGFVDSTEYRNRFKQ